MCSGLMNDSATRERRRQRQQHVAGEAPVRGVHADLPSNLETLADDVRQVVEDFGQVAAGVALDEDRRHEEPHVENRDARGHLVQRVAQREAEVLLIERLLELRADRIGHLLRDHAERRLERVSRPDGPRHQIERLGEVLFELLQSRRSAVDQPGKRRRAGEQRGDRRRVAAGGASSAVIPATAAAATRLMITIALGVVRTPGLLDEPRRRDPVPVRDTRRSNAGSGPSSACFTTVSVARHRLGGRRVRRHLVKPAVESPRGQHARQSTAMAA